jgi:hypothetical protein
LPAVLVHGRTVPYSPSVKNLGLTMDNRFSWLDQVNCVRRNVGFVLSRHWQFADVTPPVMTRKKLVQSLLIPHVLYCDVIYSRASVEVNRRLNVAINSCVRYIFGVLQINTPYQSNAQYCDVLRQNTKRLFRIL